MNIPKQPLEAQIKIKYLIVTSFSTNQMTIKKITIHGNSNASAGIPPTMRSIDVAYRSMYDSQAIDKRKRRHENFL